MSMQLNFNDKTKIDNLEKLVLNIPVRFQV